MQTPTVAIKNPLTIIGVFASLAEISGTVVLPHLGPDIQRWFVWFVMGFPVCLVLLFFYVLWHKHYVLYAPSDYKTDEAFSRLIATLQPQTIFEIEENAKANTEYAQIAQTSDDVAKARSNGTLVETLVNKKLRVRYGQYYLPNMSFEVNNKKYGVDGLINTQSRMHFFEIKYFQSPKTPLNGIGKTCAYFSEILSNMDASLRPIMKFVIIIVGQFSQEEQMSLLRRLNDVKSQYNIPLEFELWDFKDLKIEAGVNA